MDLMLNNDGDLCISKSGDIKLGDSVRQKIRIKILWFLAEWRWNPEEGIDYFPLFEKNPDTTYFESVIRSKIFEVDEVTEIGDVQITYDEKERKALIYFIAYTDDEVIEEEVKLNCMG